MQSNEGKTGDVMLKPNPLTPPFILVATPAIFPLLPFVHIIFFVARETIPLHLFGFRSLAMTGMTFKPSMPPMQWKLRVLVVLEPNPLPALRLMASHA